jgi:superfamily II RNA helicase
MYRKGIAAHHAGLHVALKRLVERLYEQKLLNIVYCTSTFALGINMPARTVIFDSLMKYNGRDFVPLTIREFMQMGGRAGRRGIDPVGEIVVRQDFDEYDEVRTLLDRLLSGESEPVESSFNLSFHSVVNLLHNHSEERIQTLGTEAVQDAQTFVEGDDATDESGADDPTPETESEADDGTDGSEAGAASDDEA